MKVSRKDKAKGKYAKPLKIKAMSIQEYYERFSMVLAKGESSFEFLLVASQKLSLIYCFLLLAKPKQIKTKQTNKKANRK